MMMGSFFGRLSAALGRVVSAVRGESSTLASPSAWLQTLFGYRPTKSGVNVDERTALGVAAVFACVRVVAEDLGSLPLGFIERTDNARREAREFYLHQLFMDGPNPEMTLGEFVETMQGHLELRGNGFSLIEWSPTGRVLALWPIHPDRVAVKRVEGELVYRVSLPAGETSPTYGGPFEWLPRRHVFHLRGFSSDGVLGLSPLELHQESIGLSVALEQHGASFFGSGAAPSGVAETDQALSDTAWERLLAQIQSHEGMTKRHRTMLFEEGVKWKQVGLPNDHAQYVESRRFQIEEAARIWRVPQHKIGHLTNAHFNNIEHMGLEYVTDTMRPRAVRWERAIRKQLMTEQERTRFFPKFNLEALHRGDLESRYRAYAIGRQWGWISANDVRANEDENPISGGDVYLSPSNMVPADQVGRPDAKPAKKEPEQDPEKAPEAPGKGPGRRLLEESFHVVFREALERVVRRESMLLAKGPGRKAFEGGGLRALDAWAREYFMGAAHQDEIRTALVGPAYALGVALGLGASEASAGASGYAAAAAEHHARQALQGLAVRAALGLEAMAEGIEHSDPAREVEAAMQRLEQTKAA